MWVYNYSDELYHYGVMGMKWGIRKQEYYTKRAGLTKARSDYANAEIKRKTKMHETITDSERARARRLENRSIKLKNKAKLITQKNKAKGYTRENLEKKLAEKGNTKLSQINDALEAKANELDKPKTERNFGQIKFSELSDADMQKAIDRLNLETRLNTSIKNYKESQKSNGRKYVEGLLDNSVQKANSKITNHVVDAAIKKVSEARLNSEEEKIKEAKIEKNKKK